MDFITISQTDFPSANYTDNENTDISASETPTEIAYAEVGDDGIFADYDGIRFGQPPQNVGRNVQGNEVFQNLASDTGGSATVSPNDTTQIKFVVRKRNSADGPNLTPYITQRGNDNTNASERDTLGRQGVRATKGRLIAIQARDLSSTFAIDMDDSVFEIPAIGYDKSEM
jgi:hypothetical protein